MDFNIKGDVDRKIKDKFMRILNENFQLGSSEQTSGESREEAFANFFSGLRGQARAPGTKPGMISA